MTVRLERWLNSVTPDHKSRLSRVREIVDAIGRMGLKDPKAAAAKLRILELLGVRAEEIADLDSKSA